MLGSISEITQLWGRVLKRIEEKLGEKQIFDSFFAGSYIYEMNGSTLVVVVNSKVAATLLDTRYRPLLEDAVKEITESRFDFKFVLESDVQSKKVEQIVNSPKTAEYFKDSKIKEELTFDNFVVGDFNREAAQASLYVASNPGKMFNPLFIYSQSGLGKTHLLHAIGNYITNVSMPGAKVLYVNANEFLEEYVKFVRGNRESESLKEYVVSHDVLLFDDVQMIADREKTQEFFFFIFLLLSKWNKHLIKKA